MKSIPQVSGGEGCEARGRVICDGFAHRPPGRTSLAAGAFLCQTRKDPARKQGRFTFVSPES